MRRVHLEPHAAAQAPPPGPSLVERAHRLGTEPLDATLDDAATLGAGLADVVRRARAEGLAAVVVEAEPVTPALADVVAGAGFGLVRTTLQLRRALPLDAASVATATTADTRPFQVGIDEDAWLAVNNRAFAWHPDQANRTRVDLERLEVEPWFRADGFLLHDRPDGTLDGFCWTKIHAAVEPPLGEIYVIGVDPDDHGRGLGRSLVVAGLGWLADQGLTHAMLYVEADNQPARHLYRSLGFVEHHAHQWWRLDLDDPGADPGGVDPEEARSPRR